MADRSSHAGKSPPFLVEADEGYRPGEAPPPEPARFVLTASGLYAKGLHVTMEGRARAPAAGTVLNALATGMGSAFAIDEDVTAEVTLSADGPAGDTDRDAVSVEASVAGHPDADTRLVERCVERVVARFGDGESGRVRTDSDVPMASGLKSSSAAANATVLATLDALGLAVGPDGDLTREAAARIGVAAAREAGVTVTGAFDDASASMLGGVTVTDNDADALLDRERFDGDVLVWTPPERAHSADADVERCRRVAPLADLVADLALDGDYGVAMTVNGFAFCGALGFPIDPLVEALPAVRGVSLSGTGPSYVAVGDSETLDDMRARWADREGTTVRTTTQNQGATIT
jgi:shikimate kinase